MTANNRLWILVTAVLAIAILALGWLLGISPKLKEASDTDATTSTIDSLNNQKSLEAQQLKTDSANLPAIKQQLADLVEQLPQNSSYPAFLTELNQIAGDNSVQVTNVAFQAPTVLAGATASTSAATPAPAATAAAPAVVTNVVPPGTTVAIPATLTMAGTFSDVQAATGALQDGSRLFLVSGLKFTKLDDNADADAAGGYTVDVTGIIYVLTDGSTLISSTEAPTPTPAATATTAP